MFASVIIPVYNGIATLEGTLQGFLTQEVAGDQFELVLCDDGSTDGSQQILARYTDDPRVKVVYQENRGQSAATNRAARLARGELLIFSAQDIVPRDRHFLSRHLQGHRQFRGDRCLSGYIRYPEEVVTNDFMIFMRDGNHQFDYQEISDPDDLDPMKLYAPNFSVKKSCFLRVGGFDESFPYGFQDSDLGIRFYLAGVKISLKDDIDCLHYHPLDFAGFALKKRSFGRSFIDLYNKQKTYYKLYRKVTLNDIFVFSFKYLLNRNLFERIFAEVKYCQDKDIEPLYELYDEFSQTVAELPPLSDKTILIGDQYHSKKYWCKYFYYSAFLSFCYCQGLVEKAVETGLITDVQFDLTPIQTENQLRSVAL